MIKLLGEGVPKDEPGGMLLLNRAAQLLVPEASYNLGIVALKPSNGPPDYATAYKRFSEAAIANNGDALYSLGVLTKDGKGVPADAKKAAEFYLAAANAGNLDGMVEYGIALFNGDGVQVDQELAGDWFERAAERGSPIARNRLARMYAAGMGLAPNPILACMWHILAKSAGLEDKQLDDFVARQTPEVQAAAMQGARYHGL
jgi:TPR repeat protein